MSLHSDKTLGQEVNSLRETVSHHHSSSSTNSSSSSSSFSHANESHALPHSRRKRFLSYPRFVELMVTADAKMARHHGRNLEHYILTIMSVVSKTLFFQNYSTLLYIVIVLHCFYIALASLHCFAFFYTVSQCSTLFLQYKPLSRSKKLCNVIAT